MTPNEYQELAMKTCGQAAHEDRLLMAALGMTGEAGEVADMIKKHLYHGHALDSEELEKEMGDEMWYISLMCTALGVSLESVMGKNIEKLQRRYPQGFSEEQSINREEYRNVKP